MKPRAPSAGRGTVCWQAASAPTHLQRDAAQGGGGDVCARRLAGQLALLPRLLRLLCHVTGHRRLHLRRPFKFQPTTARQLWLAQRGVRQRRRRPAANILRWGQERGRTQA